MRTSLQVLQILGLSLGTLVGGTCLLMWLYQLPSRRHGIDMRAPKDQHAAVSRMRELWEAMDRDWPPLSGKSFVLYAAVKRKLDMEGLLPATFFSPAWTWELATRFPSSFDEYNTLDVQSLRGGGFGHLTSFAGRRNDDPRYALEPGSGGRSDPILADAAFGDLVIVLFADGHAKRLSRSEAAGESGVITFGDRAHHPLLRPLSDE